MELEKGKLYQVNAGHISGWVIAEYMTRVPAHTAHGYRSIDGAKSWKEPAKDYWCGPLGGGFKYVTLVRGLQVRPVSAETLEEIERLKVQIREAEENVKSLRLQLRELCQ